jgi:hypothetical protein
MVAGQVQISGFLEANPSGTFPRPQITANVAEKHQDSNA